MANNNNPTAAAVRALPRSRYSFDELAEIWGLSREQVVQLFEDGKFKAEVLDHSTWRVVEPIVGVRQLPGSAGVSTGGIDVCLDLEREDPVVGVDVRNGARYTTDKLFVTHSEKQAFENRALQEQIESRPLGVSRERRLLEQLYMLAALVAKNGPPKYQKGKQSSPNASEIAKAALAEAGEAEEQASRFAQDIGAGRKHLLSS